MVVIAWHCSEGTDKEGIGPPRYLLNVRIIVEQKELKSLSYSKGLRNITWTYSLVSNSTRSLWRDFCTARCCTQHWPAVRRFPPTFCPPCPLTKTQKIGPGQPAEARMGTGDLNHAAQQSHRVTPPWIPSCYTQPRNCPPVSCRRVR